MHAYWYAVRISWRIQEWEQKRLLREAGPSRLLRPHSHHGCRQHRGRSLGQEGGNHTSIIHQERRVGFTRSNLTGGECSALGLPLVPSHLQLARDSCLSIPKHPPRFGVTTQGGGRLFGQDALLPLQSQVCIVFPVQSQRRPGRLLLHRSKRDIAEHERRYKV